MDGLPSLNDLVAQEAAKLTEEERKQTAFTAQQAPLLNEARQMFAHIPDAMARSGVPLRTTWMLSRGGWTWRGELPRPLWLLAEQLDRQPGWSTPAVLRLIGCHADGFVTCDYGLFVQNLIQPLLAQLIQSAPLPVADFMQRLTPQQAELVRSASGQLDWVQKVGNPENSAVTLRHTTVADVLKGVVVRVIDEHRSGRWER